MRHPMLAALAAGLCLAVCACATAPVPATGTQSVAVANVASPDIVELGVADLQSRMSQGELSSEALVQAYLDRIAAIDDAGPRLNAVIEANPLALQEARARDADRKAGVIRGPMHGIPVLLKDNIDATPMVNSAGSLALADHRPTDDASLVRQLRDAGAVILGKTNLSEWANFRSSRSTSGWSARGGQTKNPYALDRNPCGSSAGTGTAVAASLATVGIGTETNGSIICPAAVAGLVGIKPTVGLVSRDGIIPISRTQDTAGPMARSVGDAAALLSAIAGHDPADEATEANPAPRDDYTTALDDDALRGARIGVLRDAMGFHPGVDAAMEQSIAAMRAAGATVVDAAIPTAGQWGKAHYQLLLYEFKAGVEDYLEASNAPIRTLAGLIGFNERNAGLEMPHFGQEIFHDAQAKGPLTEPAYLEARASARRLAGPEGIDAALGALDLDALVAPATSPAWLTDLVNGDHFTGSGYGAAAVGGTPSITVPMGDVHGLPVGVVFMGPAWSERRMIGLAHAFERATQARKPPRFLPTIEIDDNVGAVPSDPPPAER